VTAQRVRADRSLLAIASRPTRGPSVKHPRALGVVSGSRLQLFPGIDMSLKAAALAFAGVLGFASWAGAASMGLGGAPFFAVAQAPPAVQSPVVQQPPPAVMPSEPTPVDSASPLAPMQQMPFDQVVPPEDNYVPPPPPPPLKIVPPNYSTPALGHVWVIALSGQGFANLFDRDTARLKGADADFGKPYLAGKLASNGLLLQNLFAVTGGSTANQAALLAGQGPKPSLRVDCPSFTESKKDGVTGKFDQAADSKSCGFGPGVPTLFSRLSAIGRSSKLYSGSVDGDPGFVDSICARPAEGKSLPVGLPAVSLFASFTGSPRCKGTVSGVAGIGDDLKSIDSTPAFSLVLPGPCRDGSATKCNGGVPSDSGTAGGLEAADSFLFEVVPKILASEAWKENGAIFIVSDRSDDKTDTSACCGDRPWYNADQSNGGGQIGALVLSPLVEPGALEASLSLDHFDLSNVIARSLGLEPLGYADHAKVTGLPKGSWGRWDGKSPRAMPR
jgi:hypothetical protein